MTRESKLYPSAIQAQCQSAIAILQADNENFLATSASVSVFVEDREIVSVSFDQLKLQCSNYIDVINSIIEVNNMDIADYQTLSSAVGSEVLEGEVIIINQERYARLRDEAYERESIYRSQAACDMDAGLKSFHYLMAEGCHYLGDFYEEQYQYWVGKELLYDSIESSTSSLFTGSGGIRTAINNLLGKLKNSFALSLGYSPNFVVPAKLQLDYIKQGDIDTANGIKALNEYLIESGKFTPNERVAIINSIVEQAPERLRALPNIISVAGTVAENSVIGGIVTGYMPDWVMEAVDNREVAVEIARWVGVTDEVADAYLDNVYTYCTRTLEDPGYGRADKRKKYLLQGIDGNLAGVEVGDDCSSFVYACLIQAGYIPTEDISKWPPSSGNYLPQKSMSTTLENAGFRWYSNDELEAKDIQQGDILVMNGHVEIFAYYDEANKEYAYTWGEIYFDEPAPKGNTVNNIWNRYEGVWRYEGK